MLQLLSEHRELAERVIAFLIDRNRHYEDDFLDHLLNPSEKRVARVLLSLWDIELSAGRDALLHITQVALAEFVGTTRGSHQSVHEQVSHDGPHSIRPRSYSRLVCGVAFIAPQRNCRMTKPYSSGHRIFSHQTRGTRADDEFATLGERLSKPLQTVFGRWLNYSTPRKYPSCCSGSPMSTTRRLLSLML